MSMLIELADDLILYFQDDVVLMDHWRVSRTHYEKTVNHWLENMDEKKDKIMPILERTYGKEEAERWRIFFMVCAELEVLEMARNGGWRTICFERGRQATKIRHTDIIDPHEPY